jgi:hypothetical protein
MHHVFVLHHVFDMKRRGPSLQVLRKMTHADCTRYSCVHVHGII